ncbi:WD repeat domain-containing protein 83 isoform X2 [Anabrus simplex]|uniref:WD repeat domain-containing protein 83 isoform X2 n=1 Tax=Anabrus simplex TaxID=316456 RepID=UPI0035A29BEF
MFLCSWSSISGILLYVIWSLTAIRSQIVSCGKDKNVILWDVSTGKILRTYHGHASSVTCVQFNEESSVAVSGSQDNTVMCWDVKSRRREPIQVLKDAKDTITSLQVTDHEILTGSVDCRVRRYDIRIGEVISDFMGESVTSVRFTWDDQCMVVGCSDNTVRLIDKDTGELLGEYVGHKTGDYLIESSTDSTDKHVISGSTEGDVWCWDLVSAAVTKRLTHARGVTVSSLSAHPKKNVILSAAADVIKLWGDPTTMDSDSE